ncbi:MAG: PPC domain-containing protein [Anaerolineae bacterium]|nr:PPC domain-containing protein [Anaerolineae bacterium]
MLAQRFVRWLMIAIVVTLAVPALPHAAAAGGAIAYGEVVSGAISSKTYFELWTFTGTKGDRVQILMEGDGALDPYLGLIYSPTEQIIAEDDDSGGNSNAYLNVALPESGEYIIVATRYDLDTGTSAGGYTLSLAGSGGPVNVSTTTTTTTGPQEVSPGIFLMGDLTLGEAIGGTITSSAYAHIYTVELQAGTNLVVAMFAADQSTLDPYLGFGTEDGEVLAEDDDSGPQVEGGQYDSFLDLTISQTGTYLILATRAGLETGTTSGDYVLIAGIPEQTAVVEEPTPEEQLPPGMVYMGAISVDTPMKGTIAADSYFHIYEYIGTANEQITITMTGGGGLDSYLGILDPSDTVIAEDDDSAGGLDAQISIRLPESGSYLILATRSGIDAGTTAGPYSLTLTAGTPPPPAGTTSSVGGFAGLPGRAIEIEGGTLYLRGFGASDNPEKCSQLGTFAGTCGDQPLPGRASLQRARPAVRELLTQSGALH